MKVKRVTRAHYAAVCRFFKRHGGKPLPDAIRVEINEIKETINYAKRKQSK